MNNLELFLQQSNKIEGINRVTSEEVHVAEWFLEQTELQVAYVNKYVKVTAPHAELRDRPGLDVRVGSYYPPRGGVYISVEFQRLLSFINEDKISPYQAHLRYENLHPFTDGNGRSGRLVWLWQMDGHAPLLFLHQFYYQALQNDGTRS